MVKCGDEALVAPPPQAAAVPSAGKSAPGIGVDQEPTYCFRLQEEAPDRDRDSAASTSVYSIYKQRIDQMFDETRSQMSSSACRTTTSYSCCQQEERRRLRREEGGGSRRPRISNSVQARIEKMFADMAEASGAAAAAAASSAAGPPPPAGAASGRFPVEYLGAVPLRDKVTTLNGLQQPLADLYLGRHHHDGAGGSGWLEICHGGLRVEARGRTWLTAFPSIAVWAAVKFVRRRRGADAQFAFLPLIADPDAVDKDALFRPLPASAGSYAERLGHSPVLAVVMRGGASGGRRQLDCHGFVCERAEDAVVVAAALYQALVAHLQREGAGRDRQPTSRHDGVSYAPAASSVAGSSEAAPSALSASSEPAHPAAGTDRTREPPPQPPQQDAAPPLPAPVRPPRKKRSSVSSASEDGEDAIKVLSSEEIPPPQKSGKKLHSQSKAQQEQSHKLPPPHQQQHLQQQQQHQQQQHQQKPQSSETHQQNQRHQLPQHQLQQQQRHQLPQQHQQQQEPAASSDPRRSAGPGPDYHDVRRQHRPAPGGDILTKVAIPRSSSFLNAGGPLSRYSGRSGAGDCGARGVGGGGGGGTLYSSDGGSSPLGFNELFTEFRVHEGLHSTDDILDAIIDAEGMSFNDLKPIYKEFLLKLAFTLTRDELYQRSKSIMRRQRKKQQKHRKGLYASGGGGGGLKRAFRRSVSKLKPRPGSFEFTSVLFQPRPARASKKCKKPTLVTGKCSSSTSSTFSSRSHKLRTGTNRLPRRLSSRRRAGAAPPKRRPTVSTSEDSDFMCGTDVRLPPRAVRSTAPATTGNIANNNRSSSGYFSCSECSYDSESCTCTSADKCYCSLGGGGGGGNVSSSRDRKHAPVTSGTTSCDSESCGAGRCCTCGVPRPSMPYRQVSKQMESPDTAWKRNERRTRAALQQQTAARKRMDVYSDVAVRPQYHLPSEFRDFSSTSDLALDYELFTVAKSDRNSVCEDRKVLVVSARDPRGRLLYVGPASCRASSSSDSQRRPHKARAPPRPGNSAASEALSVKKSAEIAALFSKPTLSAPTDEVFYNTLEPPDYYLATRGPKTATNYMTSNLENSLGYLP